MLQCTGGGWAAGTATSTPKGAMAVSTRNTKIGGSVSVKTSNHILVCLQTQETLDLVEDTCELCDARLNSVAAATNGLKGEIIDDNAQSETLWTPEWDSEAHRPDGLG